MQPTCLETALRLTRRVQPRGQLARNSYDGDTTVLEIALSIPDELFDSAETLGKRLGVFRSRLYATALADFVAKHQSRKVTARLDAIYATEDSRLDAATRRLQARSLPRDSW